MKKPKSLNIWLIAMTMLALLWTGTFWHDFFSTEIVPVIAGNQGTDRSHQSACVNASGIAAYRSFLADAGASPLPCACPSHVHSPSCLSHAEHGMVVSPARLFVQLFAFLFAQPDIPKDENVACRELPWTLTVKAGLPIYLAYRSLLI